VDLYFSSPVDIRDEFCRGCGLYCFSDAMKVIWSHCCTVTAIISVNVKIKNEVTLADMKGRSELCPRAWRRTSIQFYNHYCSFLNAITISEIDIEESESAMRRYTLSVVFLNFICKERVHFQTPFKI